jgi:hypothetical protein
MATLRNLAIGVLCRTGRVNLAAALRHHARDPAPLATSESPSGADTHEQTYRENAGALHRGHIRATNDRITADNSGHQRSRFLPVHRPHSASSAGRRKRPAVPDTEEAMNLDLQV